MHMSFWWDTKFELLFQGFSITTPTGLVFTCLGFASLAIIFEAIRVIRAFIECENVLKIETIVENPARQCPSEESALLKSPLQKKPSKLNLTIRALTYFTQEITAFLLMLVVMSYNGFLIIAIICGATLGYFLFARRTQFIYERQKIMKESAIRGCCPRCYDYKAIEENPSNK